MWAIVPSPSASESLSLRKKFIGTASVWWMNQLRRLSVLEALERLTSMDLGSTMVSRIQKGSRKPPFSVRSMRWRMCPKLAK